MRKGLLYFLKNQTTSKKFSEKNSEITYVELASSLILYAFHRQAQREAYNLRKRVKSSGRAWGFFRTQLGFLQTEIEGI